MIRRPLPLNGTPQTDAVDVEWRVAESDRPDATYRTECRDSHDSDWSPRYVFDDVARDLQYFEATNDFLQSAPESPFTGEPTVALSIETGYRKLSGDTFTEVTNTDERERTVTGDAWHAILEQEFGLRYERER